ncbi:MAG: hypothetical protein HOH58_02010 [Opitutaceae bacterium]|jgi:hypothetical protein|nr:hypothetical protein [Opitutaceae bacterium]
MNPPRFVSLRHLRLLGVFAVSPALGNEITLEPPEDEPVRGIVISCQTWGQEWGTDEMVEAMREVKALGANWVQIHPYGAVTRDGEIRMRRMPEDPDEAPIWLKRPIEEAHKLGLKICITPHVAPWRAGWGWRGEITFDSKAKWNRFFQDYKVWITRLARLCRDADGFTVGSELDQTLEGNERRWRDIIAAVREETDAPLTYAANWPDYQKVPFWDALDVISLSAYFPMVNHQRTPAPAELDRTWQRVRGEALAYARSQNKRIVFMELGYDVGMNAAREPWEDGDRREGGEALQAMLLDRALSAVKEEDDLIGTFLWKWFAGPVRRETFMVSAPHMREVVARHWAEESVDNAADL